MNNRAFYGLALSAVLLAGCQGSNEHEDVADIVFVGDHIITMDADNTGATGVAVRGDTIVAIGDRDGMMAMAGEGARVVELGDRALVPGFIDSHGHAGFQARIMDFVNLSSPPVGTAENIDDVVALLDAHVSAKPPAEGEWVIGYGYDDSLLAENRHPERDDLDRVATDLPIYIMHVSGHLGAVNSAALGAVGIDAESVDPPGGVIRRRPGTTVPNGVLEEKAASGVMSQRLGAVTGERFEDRLREMVDLYAAYGITTIQDGYTSPFEIAAFRAAAARAPFRVDIAAYRGAISISADEFDLFRHDNDYTDGYRVAGVKFSLDGSPQGRTAWLTQPYTEGPEGADLDYVAYPTVEPDEYKRTMAPLVNRGVPLIIHANGDAAIDLMIESVADALGDGPVPDHRSVIIHAQLMRADQVDLAAALGIVPSFFSAHTFFWGDWHQQSFGSARGENISPTRWAMDRDVPFTIHNDAPIVPPDMMRLMWATVNRQTRSGQVIGPEQRLTVEEALHAMTLAGAYQLFEEDTKGSITVGKRADLVILGENPLAADPMTLKDIHIVETIAGGRTVFLRR